MKSQENIDYKGSNKTLIVGLGKTGLSCARFLSKRGFQVAVTDNRNAPPALDALRESVPNAAVFLGGFESQVFRAAETIVLSPGIARSEPLVAEAIARGVRVIGDIEIFAQFVKAPVIGITGSNGKSTVTTLVAELIAAAGYRVAVGGNLGVPALDLLDEEEKDFYVLELSSFQLDSTYSLNCATSVILNISPDHIDQHGTMADYVRAKARIYHGTGHIVINNDEPLPEPVDLSARAVCRYGLSNEQGSVDVGVRIQGGEEWVAAGETFVLPVKKLRLQGRHNLSNALAALSLVRTLGVPLENISAVLARFCGLPHRMQFVVEHNGVTWINDSKGTNVGATIAALSGLATKTVLIAGGQGKGADFSLLKNVVRDKARAVVLLGQDAALIENAIEQAVPVTRVASMDEAVRAAQRLAQIGDTVLLSPACASFDMFKGYDDRGDTYVKAVHALYSRGESTQ